MNEIHINYMLGGIIICLIVIFFRLGTILVRMQENIMVEIDNSNDLYKKTDELLSSQNEALEELSLNIQQIQLDVADMKQVSDIFYEYKLPNKEERELIDQIAIDNESGF